MKSEPLERQKQSPGIRLCLVAAQSSRSQRRVTRRRGRRNPNTNTALGSSEPIAVEEEKSFVPLGFLFPSSLTPLGRRHQKVAQGSSGGEIGASNK